MNTYDTSASEIRQTFEKQSLPTTTKDLPWYSNKNANNMGVL